MSTTSHASFLFACAASVGSAAAQSLVGDTILRVSQPQSSGIVGDPQFAVVTDPGVEFIDSFPFPPGEFRRFNIGATSIRMDNTATWFSPWFDTGHLPSYIEFRDLDFGDPAWSIGGVNVTWGGGVSIEDDAPINYPAFSSNAVIFNADTVRLYIGPYQFEAGSWVQIDLAIVPAPGAVAMAGVAGMIALRRRR